MHRLKQIYKAVLKTLRWIGFTLAILLAIFISINLFDEKLDPHAEAILNTRSTVKPADNAYFYWERIFTSPMRNPSEAGEKCVLAQRESAISEPFFVKPEALPECVEPEELKPLNDRSIVCDWRKKACLAQYFSQRAIIDQLAANHRLLLERYAHLLAFKQFDDSRPFPVIRLKALHTNLYQAISATKLQDGNTAEFMQRTEAETAFYRMVLASENSLISKMIAVAFLERNARLISDAVKLRPGLAEQNQARLLRITAPLSAGERSMQKAMEGEFRFSIASLRLMAVTKLPDEGFSFEHELAFPIAYKRDATANDYFHNAMFWGSLSELPMEKYLSAEARALQDMNYRHYSYLHFVYNPIGKTLLAIGSSVYAPYGKRVVDSDGLLRLVALQIQIAALKIPEEGIPAFLKTSNPEYHDPYTGQPMQWNKERGLFFRGHGEREEMSMVLFRSRFKVTNPRL